MNPVITLFVGILIIYTMMAGMLWATLGLALFLVILQFSKRNNSQSPMFYPSGGNMAIDSPGEQMLKVKFMDNWDGYDSDPEIGHSEPFFATDLVGDHIGSGIGRGLGFLR